MCKDGCNADMLTLVKHMQEYVAEREKNNESAYSKKWMNKPKFT